MYQPVTFENYNLFIINRLTCRANVYGIQSGKHFIIHPYRLSSIAPCKEAILP